MLASDYAVNIFTIEKSIFEVQPIQLFSWVLDFHIPDMPRQYEVHFFSKRFQLAQSSNKYMLMPQRYFENQF